MPRSLVQLLSFALSASFCLVLELQYTPVQRPSVAGRKGHETRGKAAARNSPPVGGKQCSSGTIWLGWVAYHQFVRAAVAYFTRQKERREDAAARSQLKKKAPFQEALAHTNVIAANRFGPRRLIQPYPVPVPPVTITHTTLKDRYFVFATKRKKKEKKK